MEVLEHCTNERREAALADVRRLVADNGHVIISVPIEIGPPIVLKQLIRNIMSRTVGGDYAERETYSAREMLRTLFVPGDDVTLPRPVYRADFADRPNLYHGHKGFNFRELRARLRQDFEIVAEHYTPVGGVWWLNSQVWLVCRRTEDGKEETTRRKQLGGNNEEETAR